MEKSDNIKMFATCPKCGHWCVANASTDWIEKTLYVGSCCSEVEDEIVKEKKTKLGKFGARIFCTVYHIPNTLFLGHYVNKNEIASFKCICGKEWVDKGCTTDEWNRKIETDIELADSSVPIEKSYEMLRTIYNYMNVDEQYGDILNELYSKLKTRYIKDFSEMPNYARRFVWITRDNNITSYPEKICLLTLKEACSIDAKFENEVIGDTLYVKHPYKNIYYPRNSYGISLFEDEVEDFIDIMACVGAKKISTFIKDESSGNKSKNYTSSTTFNGNHNGIEVQCSENYKNEEEQSFYQQIKRIEEHNFDFKNRTRRFPRPGEYAWYDAKEKWKRKVARVIEHNECTMDFSLSIQEELFISQKEMDAIQLDIKNISGSSSVGAGNTETSQATNKKYHSREIIAHVEFFGESEIKREGRVKSFFNGLLSRE